MQIRREVWVMVGFSPADRLYGAIYEAVQLVSSAREQSLTRPPADLPF
jgi:hypothetical protein